MKTKIFIVCAFQLLLMLSSCSDFLDEQPKGRIKSETFFSTQDELNMSVYSLYRRVMETQVNTNLQIPQWMGDDITANPGSNKQAYAEFDRFLVANNNKGVERCWAVYYSLIKAANYVIMNAAKTPTSVEEINIAIGQAKYWRAYSYFTLVRIYGKLPINLTTEIDPKTPLSTVKEVYTLIVDDLKACENLLPVSYTTSPRIINGADVYITKQAAKATLAAVYMAMAGWPLKETQNYSLAAAKAKEVIDGVKSGIYNYIIETEFKYVYSQSRNFTRETVVGINYQQTYIWDQDSQLTSCNLFESVGGWGDGWGEIRFWKNMPDGPRKDAIYAPKILLRNGTLVNFWDKNPSAVNLVPENHPMFSVFSAGGTGNTDYDYTKTPSTSMTNSNRHRCIRYSEVLLWYAESQARADGTPNALAYECINAVRNRAGLTNLTAGLSGSAFADAALAEHGWEVAGNWVALVTRRADQLRMELLQQTFNERATNDPVTVAPGVTVTESVVFVNKTWNEKLVYAPYPSTDASLNPNLK